MYLLQLKDDVQQCTLYLSITSLKPFTNSISVSKLETEDAQQDFRFNKN